MATARASVFFPCPAEQVFSAVTDLSQTGWRSDLAGVEVLDEARFVERTKSGYATHFVITACAPPRLWALRMKTETSLAAGAAALRRRGAAPGWTASRGRRQSAGGCGPLSCGIFGGSSGGI